ncbi:MAG: HDOD domain-containing protein [Candidatus Wallbacteria bacterium]
MPSLLEALKLAKERGAAQQSGQSPTPGGTAGITGQIFNIQQQAQPKQPVSPYSLNSDIVSKILDTITDIPTLPTIATKVMDSINNTDATAKDVADIIKNDQALTAKILQVSNSAYYAGYSQCTTVQNAIARLGLLQIKRMVLSISIFETFNKYQNTIFNLKDFWTHSIAVAHASKIIGKLSNFSDSDDLFTAGLLHDIGKLITIKYLPEMFEEIIKKMQSYPPDTAYFDIEKNEFPVNHCDIGSWLSIKWKMSREIQSVIFNHHLPPITSTIFDKNLIMFSAIVYIADKLVKKLELGFSGDKNCLIDQEILNYVLKGKTTAEKICEELTKCKNIIEATTAVA